MNTVNDNKWERYQQALGGLWYWGIEDMIYQDGWIKFKGRKVEHFDSDYAITFEARDYALKLSTIELNGGIK